MKKQINEEINSMKFLLNYKRGVVISEQTTQQTPEKDIVDKIILATGNQYSLGTNEDDFMKALSLIKDKQTYDKVNSYFANNPFNNYKSIVDILNGELESDNLARAVQAKEYLKNVGLILSYSVRDKDRYGRPLAAKSLIPGTFKIGVSSSSKTNTVKKITPIPSELENIEGVKVFQNWLDLYKEGWATGFTGGILNKGAGYGTFGPRTKNAWNLYGKEYLQLLNNTKDNSGESPWMKSQLEKIKTEKPTNSFTAPIQKVGTPLQSAQNPAPTVNQGLSQLKPQ